MTSSLNICDDPPPGETFKYFAYGSNLFTDRIHYQNPSAQYVGNAKLEGFKLGFRISSKVYCYEHSFVTMDVPKLWTLNMDVPQS